MTAILQKMNEATPLCTSIISNVADVWGTAIDNNYDFNIALPYLYEEMGLSVQTPELAIDDPDAPLAWYYCTDTEVGLFNSDQAGCIEKDNYMLDDLSDLDVLNSEIDQMLATLKNPPEDFSDVYDDFKTLYVTYDGLYQLAVEPSGSFQSYCTDSNDLSNDFESQCKIVKIGL